MSKISIITAVYKVEEYLEDCIKSILQQSFADFDLILVDDGSPDRCGAICDEYAKKDSRIVVIHKENGGLSDARNVGLEWAFSNSRSEWVTFIDSDDQVHYQFLEHLYSAAVKADVSIASTPLLQVYDHDNEMPAYDFDYRVFDVEEFWCEHKMYALMSGGKLFKKNLFADKKFLKGVLHEDAYLIPIVFFESEKIVFVPHGMYYYFFNQEGITKSEWHVGRVHQLYAAKCLVDYLKKTKYKRAYKKAVQDYIFMYYYVLIHLRELKEEKKLYKKLLRKYRIVILKGKWYGYSFFRDKSMYLLAYPFLGYFFALKSRVAKIGKN